MAKGNDGNLFQHTIEVEAAATLLKGRRDDGIYLVSTHAMAPVEPFDGSAKSRASTKIGSKLRVASSAAATSDAYPWIIRAYAGVEASEVAYPNSAVLLDWLCGQHGVELDGTLVEVVSTKIDALRVRFSNLTVLSGSWRTHLDVLGPKSDKSWIVSMDPMQFVSGADRDNDRMTEADLERLAPLLSAYIRTQTAGLMAMFSYSMRRDQREHLVDAVGRIFGRLQGIKLGLLETRNYTSDFHMAVLASREVEVMQAARQATLSVLGGHARDHDDFEVGWNVFSSE